MARLRALIFTAALPTLLAAAIAAGLTGITPPKAAALAGLAAFFALRAGAGAIRDAVPYRAPLYIMAAAGIALIYREIGRASPEDWLRIAAAAGAVGVVGIVVERFGLSEERLRAGARDAAEAALRR
jgi:hypothetical protein